MSWLNSIADYLTTNSLGTQGTDLFINTMPDNTALVTTLSEYEGSFNETFGSGMAISVPSLQVRVRGAAEDYATPRARIRAIQDLLLAVTNTTINGTTFLRIRPQSTVLNLGQDERLRWEFSLNFEVTIAGI